MSWYATLYDNRGTAPKAGSRPFAIHARLMAEAEVYAACAELAEDCFATQLENAGLGFIHVRVDRLEVEEC